MSKCCLYSIGGLQLTLQAVMSRYFIAYRLMLRRPETSATIKFRIE